MVGCAALYVRAPKSLRAQAFHLRTYAAGLGSMTATNGVAVADYDGDGDLDVYIVAREAYSRPDSRTWNRLFSNRGDGTFSIVTTSPELAGLGSKPALSPYGYKLGAAWGDYDNDGRPDLYLTNLGPNQLLHNNGDGTFSDITDQSGLAGCDGVLSSSAIWFDYDLDGDLDLYVSNWEFYGSGQDNEEGDDCERGRENRLYRNDGNGRFEDVSESAGVGDDGATWMTVAFDVNSDGYPDLYLANDFGPNRLYLNMGRGTFEDATTGFGVEDWYHGMGLAIADVDGNGHFDVYLTNISLPSFDQETNPLFLNTGEGHFERAPVDVGVGQAGWGWGTAFFDLENDGDEDLFVVTGNFDSSNPNVLFVNSSEAERLRFEEAAEMLGVADLTPGRGLAVFDYDSDGDQDLLISNVFEAVSLYENRASYGSWLQVALEGTASNRNAVGAVVEVETEGRSYRRYFHGAQFLAQSIVPVHFGLDAAQTAAEVTVFWPSGQIETLEDVPLNQLVVVREGAGLVTGGTSTSTAGSVQPPAAKKGGNYPDPFGSSTTVPFKARMAGRARLIVRNATGRTVDVVDKHAGDSGAHFIEWRPPAALGSGVYFYEIIMGQGDVVAAGIMVFVRS